MRRTTLAATLAGVLLTGVLAASPAQADGPHDGPVTVETEVPAGGSSSLTSQTIPKSSTGVKVVVKPKAIDATQEDVYDNFLNTLGTLSKAGRLLVCVMMYQTLATPHDFYSDERQFSAASLSQSGAVLLACLRLAGLIQSKAPPQDRMARPTGGARAAMAATCDQARPSIPVTLTHEDGTWTVDASGTVKKAKHPKVKVGCTVKGNRITYKVRNATKGAPIRKAVGKRLSFGIASPPDAEASVPVAVTFDPF